MVVQSAIFVNYHEDRQVRPVRRCDVIALVMAAGARLPFGFLDAQPAVIRGDLRLRFRSAGDVREQGARRRCRWDRIRQPRRLRPE
jgi:hypothetical protein